MDRQGNRYVMVLAAALAAGCGSSTPGTGTAIDSDLPKGCTAAAVAHDAQAAGVAPLACAYRTGYASAETHIRIGAGGVVVQLPAVLTPGALGTGFVPGAPGPRPETQFSPSALAVSRDQGETWSLLNPAGATWVPQDASLHIDRDDGRIFYYGLAVNPIPAAGVPLPDQVPSVSAHLLASGDQGRTWAITALFGYVNSENPRFTTAPPMAGQPAPPGGGNVAYWCGNNMLFTFVVRICHRSLDGGATWEQRGILLSKGMPRHAECGRSGEEFSTYDGFYPQGGPDGSLWQLVACAGKTYLARSIDQAATFPILREIPPAEELRVDRDGTLYAVHQEGASLLLRTSRDAGASWSAPRDLAAPAARGASILQWALAVRAPGEVALATLAARTDAGFDGYVTLTRNALAARPAVWSARFDTEGAPLVTTPMSAKDDYIDVDIGPDGAAWAAFYADCRGADDPACAQAGGPNPLGKATVVARLGWR